MLIKRPADIPSSEMTSESVYLNRRDFIAGLVVAGAVGGPIMRPRRAAAQPAAELPGYQQKDWSKVRSELDEPLNSHEDVTTYNNFYEFGTGKGDPAENAHTLRPRPWTIEVDGLCANPGTYGLEDFIGSGKMEDRVYRLRCVEAWSMVVPWHGFSLKDVIDRAEPLGSARYVEFTTLHDLEQMPQQRRFVLEWPYVEGLRLDEALHPLTMLVTGVYGRELPNPERGPAATHHPVEVRLQRHQVDREDALYRGAASQLLAAADALGVQLLRQREPRGGPSALESGAGAPPG